MLLPPRPTRTGPAPSCPSSAPPAKLSHAGEDVKEQPAAGRGCVDGLIEHHQVYSEGLELAHHGHQVMARAGQAVELHTGHNIDLAWPDGSQHGVEGRALLLYPGLAVVNELGDCPAASFGKGVQGQELVRADLIVSADPGIDRGATRFAWLMPRPPSGRSGSSRTSYPLLWLLWRPIVAAKDP